MTQIAFIGLGRMGKPMAHNLIRHNHQVFVYDLEPENIAYCQQAGGIACHSAIEAAQQAEVIISMLPEERQCIQVYMDENGVFENISTPKLIIDCSTIDMITSQELHDEALKWGHQFLDAPVSGGVLGAEEGKLTFMVGGTLETFERAQPLLQNMGKNVFHAGEATHGLAAKICNNLMLGIHMVGTSEAFILAERLNLAKEKLFQIASAASGQSWVLDHYCPVEGILPSVPANNNYHPGFAGTMMLKDLKLAVDAAHNADISIPLTERAEKLYTDFCQTSGDLDFSAIIQYLSNHRF